MQQSKVRVQYRDEYGEDWKDLLRTDVTGHTLMGRLYKYHAQQPERHLAVYIDGRLDHGWFPQTGYAQPNPASIEVNGETYYKDA